jgi:hypothetical protein
MERRIALLFWLLSGSNMTIEKKANSLVMVADDLGFSDLSAY